jgi:hypothetical protein
VDLNISLSASLRVTTTKTTWACQPLCSVLCSSVPKAVKRCRVVNDKLNRENIDSKLASYILIDIPKSNNKQREISA